MSELETYELRDMADNADEGWFVAKKRTSELFRQAADEIDRLRELVDILRSIPGASITEEK